MIHLIVHHKHRPCWPNSMPLFLISSNLTPAADQEVSLEIENKERKQGLG